MLVDKVWLTRDDHKETIRWVFRLDAISLSLGSCLDVPEIQLSTETFMTEEQSRREAFQDALVRLINQYSLEFDMTIGDIALALRQEEFRLMAKLHRLKQWKDGE